MNTGHIASEDGIIISSQIYLVTYLKPLFSFHQKDITSTKTDCVCVYAKFGHYNSLVVVVCISITVYFILLFIHKIYLLVYYCLFSGFYLYYFVFFNERAVAYIRFKKAVTFGIVPHFSFFVLIKMDLREIQFIVTIGFVKKTSFNYTHHL